MKLATSPIYASVTGDLASVQMIPGALVDLDKVIGHQHGAPVTLQTALGDLAAGFAPVGTGDADDTRKPARRAPQPPAPAADEKE